MSDECREAFEEWYVKECGSKPYKTASGDYAWSSTREDWRVWQAAWNRRAPSEKEQEMRLVLYDWLNCADRPEEWMRCRNNAKIVLGIDAEPKTIELPAPPKEG